MFSLTILIGFMTFHSTISTELSLARYGVTIANNSVIDINLVGEGYSGVPQTDSGALECHTDDITCCRGIDSPNGTGRGEWYYPDGTVVPPPGGDGFYRARNHMVIRLNRGGFTRSPTGMYRCDIPVAGGSILTRYIQLGTGCICYTDNAPSAFNAKLIIIIFYPLISPDNLFYN